MFSVSDILSALDFLGTETELLLFFNLKLQGHLKTFCTKVVKWPSKRGQYLVVCLNPPSLSSTISNVRERDSPVYSGRRALIVLR